MIISFVFYRCKPLGVWSFTFATMAGVILNTEPTNAKLVVCTILSTLSWLCFHTWLASSSACAASSKRMIRFKDGTG